MKLDRRTFIGIVVGAGLGAGAGVNLSPLPWKLTDDISIWTQNWPWVPVPEEGRVSHADTICQVCPGHCGITVRKVKDRAVKIEGKEGYPINDGGICPLGAAGLQLLYGPWRAPGPMRRLGKRGEGKWEQISWDEAINEVVSRLSDLRNQNKPETVACITSDDRGTVPQLFARFMKAYGSPNFVAGTSADATSSIAMELAQGKRASVGFDLEEADYVVSFGSGIIEGWGSPVRSIQAYSKWRSKKGSGAPTLVQIEPRLSNTAAKADRWYPVKPGTEATLALGLAHVMMKESLFDIGFVEGSTSNFNDWKEMVLNRYGLEDVSRSTGLSTEDITELARNFAKAKRPLAVWGRGKGTAPGSLYECMAILSLNALVGNMNRRGGMWANLCDTDMGWPDIPQDAIAENGLDTPRLDEAGTDEYPLAKYRPDALPQAMNENPDAVQALLVYEADPYYTYLDSTQVAKAFSRIPYIVSFSSYFDDTAAHADLILPNHNYLERWEDVPSPPELPKPIVGLSKPAISPQLDTRYAADTLMTIAKKLGGTVSNAFPWKDYESVLKQTLGEDWGVLSKKGYMEKRFETENQFAFYTEYQEPIRAEGSSYRYPLTLIPVELIRLADRRIGNPPFCTKSLETTELEGQDLFVDVNPKTCFDFGLADGKHALLETPQGKAKVLVHASEGIMPGVVGIPKGLGHTGYDEYLAGKGVNANTFLGVVDDPISGLCATWGIRARLTSV
jgi:anaerobic selenocysteine-containing dehydrogenase